MIENNIRCTECGKYFGPGTEEDARSRGWVDYLDLHGGEADWYCHDCDAEWLDNLEDGQI